MVRAERPPDAAPTVEPPAAEAPRIAPPRIDAPRIDAPQAQSPIPEPTAVESTPVVITHDDHGVAPIVTREDLGLDHDADQSSTTG